MLAVEELKELACLRDTGQVGAHTHNNSGVKRSVSVSEYIYADYPLPPLQRFVQGFVGGYYNRYYLAEDYDVNPVYVLDMYQHGKESWMLDILLRLAVCVAAAVIVWGIKKALKCRFPTRDE